MNYKTFLTDSAKKDIREATDYIINRLYSKQAAHDLIGAVRDADARLSENPNIYPFVNDDLLAAMGYRFIKVKNYLLFFTVDEENKRVYELRFLFSRRSWQRELIK